VLEQELDTSKHKILKGNHDSYHQYYSGDLGDYGTFELNGIKGFFIRGAFSVDSARRIRHEQLTGEKIWWLEEQLSIPKLREAVDLYKKIKPDFMLSHAAPTKWLRKVGSKKVLAGFGFDPETFDTNTQAALQECFEYHKPKLWIYGHIHTWKNKTWHGTRFICQRELGYVDINENLDIVGCNCKQSHHYVEGSIPCS
jgi:predicted phosphohydrolase